MSSNYTTDDSHAYYNGKILENASGRTDGWFSDLFGESHECVCRPSSFHNHHVR